MSEQTLPALTDPVGASEITYGELALIGADLLTWVMVVQQLGHTSPGNSLDYIHAETCSPTARIVRDFVAWTSGRTSYAPACRESLLWLINESKWVDQVHDNLADLLDTA